MGPDLSAVSGHVIVVMAPMGSGKGTIVSRALKNHKGLNQTVSCTSRAKRPGEVEGKQYYFMTESEFEARVEKGDFLEWAVFAGHKYGTLKSEILPRISKGEVVIVEIELQGVEQLLKLLPRDRMTITYIEAGGWEILQKRAEERAPMSEEEMKARHERFVIEKQSKPLADIIINNSEGIEKAYLEFDQVIEKAYKKCNK